MPPQLSGMYDSGKSADEWWFFRIYETAGRGDFTVRQTWTDNQRRRAVLQAKALADLIQEVRKKTDLGVMIYTGFTLEELQEADNPDYNLLLEQCDLLVDGPYIDELNDSKNLRGSSNQRAIPLTDRYAEYAKQIGTKPAEIEMFYEEEKSESSEYHPKICLKK